LKGTVKSPSVGRRSLPAGYERILSGVKYDVVTSAKVKAELRKKASREQMAGLEALMKKYAESGPQGLPRTKFSGDEGWFPSKKAAGKIRLEAFKPWQLRAYGFCCEFDGRPTFFVTGLDPSKKQDDANQNILAAAGREAVRVNELLQGQGV
jgi:hypothetical protein